MNPPELEFVCEVQARVAAPVLVGPTPAGLRRVVDILEGSFDGPLLRGAILPGGADWQIVRPDGVVELHARYLLRTHDGVLVQVNNRGLRHGPEEVLRRIAEGGHADPGEYYFRTTPVFEAPSGPYEWLNRNIFVATAVRASLGVTVRIFRIC